MKKNLLFAALSAVALTAGFTSCSDDDENNPSDKKYSEVYRLKYEAPTKDSVALKTVQEAYTKAIATSADSVLVSGKDSADCATQFSKLMEKAESALSSNTWDNPVIVRAFDSDHDRVYEMVYMQEDNALFSYNKTELFDDKEDAKDLEKLGDKDVYVRTVYIDDNDAWFYDREGEEGMTDYYISENLNLGNDGTNVAMCAFVTEKPSDLYITGLMLFVADERGNFPTSFRYEGCFYHAASVFNANEKTNGKQMRLYYTRDYTGRRLLANGLAMCWDYEYKWKSIFNPFSRYVEYYTPTLDKHMNNLPDRFKNNPKYEVEFVKGCTLEYGIDANITYEDGVNFNLGVPNCYDIRVRTVWEVLDK